MNLWIALSYLEFSVRNIRPRPPAAPTIPVITPISALKRCGTSWNTEPFPIPKAIMAMKSITVVKESAGSVEIPAIIKPTTP